MFAISPFSFSLFQQRLCGFDVKISKIQTAISRMRTRADVCAFHTL
jgi:hypothetical protein